MPDGRPVLDKLSANADLAAHLTDELGLEKAKLAVGLRDENLPCAKNNEIAFGARIIIEESELHDS
jgi:hypothetical protein